ncbi:DUF4265 domain-containing protein [Streptosporangium sp. NPDC000509]|uniref:DUF4265 domain-containing protein n=1 Tax=Streptosporangium sp. NPDC000509 TaxID=3366186 RepID=UPI0036D01DAA
MSVMASTTSPEHDTTENNRIKVWFRFVPREGGASLQHRRTLGHAAWRGHRPSGKRPLSARGVAMGDVVRFATDAEGLHWAKERAEASGSCTVRVLAVPSGPLGPSAQAVHERRHQPPDPGA